MPTKKFPSLCLHKPSGRGYVTLPGPPKPIVVYLGEYGTDVCQTAYKKAIAEWLNRGCQPPPEKTVIDKGPSVNVVAEQFLDHAIEYYHLTSGRRLASEVSNIKLSIRPLREMFGHLPAREFTPQALKTYRQKLIEVNLSRSECNRRTQIVVRMFKFAGSEGLAPPSVWQDLRCVDGLRKGRSAARETSPVKPVPVAFVEATLPYLPRPVRAMVLVQLYSGCRPGEVLALKTRDIDVTGRIWTASLTEHKTAHHGHSRTLYFGPKAQAVLRDFLRTELDAPMFSPVEAEAERRAGQRQARATKLWPSHVKAQELKRARSPQRAPRDRYDRDSYRRAIKYAIARANKDRVSKRLAPIPSWHPHQLRHTCATLLRKEFGAEVARVVLGHESLEVTEIYAEADTTKALDVMARFG